MIVPRMMLTEGRRVLLVNPNGSTEEIALRPHDASIALDREELLSEEFTFNEVGEQLGSQLGQQMDKELLEKISQLPPHLGGMFSSKDAESLLEEFLQKIEAMNVAFDEDEAPEVAMVVSPEMAKQLQVVDRSRLDARAAEIMERKRREWAHRESYRRLAD